MEMVLMQAQKERNRKLSINGKPLVLNCWRKRESRGKLQCSVIAAHTDRRVAVRKQWGVCDATLTDCLSDSLISINLSVCCHTSTGALSLCLSHSSFPPFWLLLCLLPTIPTASRFSFSCLWPFLVYFFSAYLIISLSFRKTADVHFLSAQINKYHLGYVGIGYFSPDSLIKTKHSVYHWN